MARETVYKYDSFAAAASVPQQIAAPPSSNGQLQQGLRYSRRTNEAMLRRVALWTGSAIAFGAGGYAAAVWSRPANPTGQAADPNGTTPRSEAHSLYNKWASCYDMKVGRDETIFMINRLRKRLISKASGEVLEIAAGVYFFLSDSRIDYLRRNLTFSSAVAGSGRNQEFYPKGVNLTMVDISEKMLQKAKEKVGPNTIQPRFDIADAHQLPYSDQSFDTVVDTFGLCSFEQPDQVLLEMQRVCKSDGKILLLEHGKSSWEWLTEYLNNRAASRAHVWGCWWNRDIRALVERSGMQVVQESRHHLGTNYLVVAKPKRPTP